MDRVGGYAGLVELELDSRRYHDLVLVMEAEHDARFIREAEGGV